jgi:folate-dependent phosphoribosylglycinamide formyltransferase PurN
MRPVEIVSQHATRRAAEEYVRQHGAFTHSVVRGCDGGYLVVREGE